MSSEGRRARVTEAYTRHINPGKARVLGARGLDVIEAGRSGSIVVGDDGRRYIDCISGFGVFNAGRNEPRLVAALAFGPRMAEELSRRGVLAIMTGTEPELMRIMPTLRITQAEVEMVLAALEDSLAAVLESAPAPA